MQEGVTGVQGLSDSWHSALTPTQEPCGWAGNGTVQVEAFERPQRRRKGPFSVTLFTPGWHFLVILNHVQDLEEHLLQRKRALPRMFSS